MSNTFSSQGEYSTALFGLLLIFCVMIVPGGIVGGFQRLFISLMGRAKANPKEDLDHQTKGDADGHAKGERL
jgi:hypothetical protein